MICDWIPPLTLSSKIGEFHRVFLTFVSLFLSLSLFVYSDIWFELKQFLSSRFTSLVTFSGTAVPSAIAEWLPSAMTTDDSWHDSLAVFTDGNYRFG